MYWIYGKHSALAALQNKNRHCLELLVTDSMAKEIAHLRHIPSPHIVKAQQITAAIQHDAPHQGIAVKVKALPKKTLETLGNHNHILMLDQVTDPHNIGAIIRSSVGFNTTALITQNRHSAEESGSIAKAASGALEAIDWVEVTNISRAIEALKKQGFWSIGLDGHTNMPLSGIDVPQKWLLIMGAEGKGLRHQTKKQCDFLCTIPINPALESLNVSNAAAVALYILHHPVTAS